MDITDAECVLADLVSKSRFIKITSEEFNATCEEGGVSRLGEVDFCTEEGQAGQSGFKTCSHDVDEAALHA